MFSRTSYALLSVLTYSLVSLASAEIVRIEQIPTRNEWTGDDYIPPEIKLDERTIVLEEVSDSPATHVCDSILVGKEDDGCVSDVGCKLLERRAIAHSIWSSNTYLCVGTLDSRYGESAASVLLSRVGANDTIGANIMVLPTYYEPFYVGAAYIAGPSTISYEVHKQAFNHLRFVRYSEHDFGLIGGDCMRDISNDVAECAKGEVVGSEYRYESESIDPAFCSDKVARANFAFFCRDWPASLGIRVDLPCHVRFSPLVETAAYRDTNDVAPVWHTQLVACDAGRRHYEQLSSMLGIEYAPGVIGSRGTANGTYLPCLLKSEKHIRSLRLTHVDHSFMSGTVHLLGRVLHTLMVNVVEPVLREIFRVVWVLVWYTVIEPIKLLLNSVIANTASFLTMVVTCVFLVWYTVRRIQKLTSSGIYVTVEKEDSIYKQTTVPHF